jgi:hypothetical protein
MIYKLHFVPDQIPLGLLAIRTDFLWHLVLIFSGISLLCFLFIFHFRSRLSSRERLHADRKAELAPMLQNFMLHQAGTPSMEAPESLWMKMELRRLLKRPLDRAVIAEIMHEVQREALPETRLRISRLYQSFGLHEDAVRKLSGRKWDKISQALSQLTEMQVTQAYDAIKAHVNSKNGIVRKQAQLAIIGLREEGIQYFLDTCRHPISQWQQVRIIEILTSRPGFSPPSFNKWFVSENQEVVLFALTLVRIFRQYEAGETLLMFLNHRSERLQIAALECLSEFRYEGARTHLLTHFAGATPELKIHILSALEAIGNSLDIPWLEARAADDPSFMVRSKARFVAESLRKDQELAGIGIQGEFDFWPSEAQNDSDGIPDGDSIPQEAEAGPMPPPVYSEPSLINTLKPDFSATETPQRQDRQLKILLTETPSKIPAEGWGEEAERVFGDCIVEELTDLITPTAMQDDPVVNSPRFLPLVVDQAAGERTLAPEEWSPERIRQLEVHAESLYGASGYLGILREILLEELREIAHVLDTEFVPATGGGTPPGIPPGPEVEEGEDPIPDLFPEFDVSPEEIHQAEGHENSHSQQSGGEHHNGNYSIFEEYFRSYDVESKLILMDEISIVGGNKELFFLERLFSDPNPKIRKKARKVHALLASALTSDPEAPPISNPNVLWTPAGKSEGCVEPAEEGTDEDTSPFSFSPDPDFCFPGEMKQGKAVFPSAGPARSSSANKTKDTKNDSDAY